MLTSLLRQLFGRQRVLPVASIDGIELGTDNKRVLDAAIAHLKAREFAASVALCEELLARDPGLAAAHEVLGINALEQEDEEGACRAFDRAIEIAGASPRTLGNAAEMHRRAAHYDTALALCDRALVLEPGHAQALHIRALCLESCWRMEEALAAYRAAIAADPSFKRANSGYLFFLLRVGAPQEEVLEAHKAWSRRHFPPAQYLHHENVRDPLRRLKVGYVSADFRDHAAAAFIAPVLRAHDRGGFEVTCYSNNGRDDERTEELKGLADHWRDVRDLKDDAMAEQIQADGIDILIDLGGLSDHNRLSSMALGPAPIQATWLGYPGTLAIPAIQYRITDEFTDLPQADRYYTESLRRLKCLWCFEPPQDMPAPGPLPALSNGTVTFASPNSMFKLSTRTVALWSRLLREMPAARLAMATIPQSEARQRIIGEFQRHGVDPSRIQFERTTGRRPFWDWLNRVDIALDSFPCNGGATTSETLWMGVPVITLAGEAFLSRAGLSLMQNIGRPGWIATSDDEFIAIALRLAGDLPALARERSQMRDHLRSTRLLDSLAFIQELESHYRSMWREWCERPTV